MAAALFAGSGQSSWTQPKPVPALSIAQLRADMQADNPQRQSDAFFALLRDKSLQAAVGVPGIQRFVEQAAQRFVKDGRIQFWALAHVLRRFSSGNYIDVKDNPLVLRNMRQLLLEPLVSNANAFDALLTEAESEDPERRELVLEVMGAMPPALERYRQMFFVQAYENLFMQMQKDQDRIVRQGVLESWLREPPHFLGVVESIRRRASLRRSTPQSMMFLSMEIRSLEFYWDGAFYRHRNMLSALQNFVVRELTNANPEAINAVIEAIELLIQQPSLIPPSGYKELEAAVMSSPLPEGSKQKLLQRIRIHIPRGLFGGFPSGQQVLNRAS